MPEGLQRLREALGRAIPLILTATTILITLAGGFATVYADIEKNKTEISNLKANFIKADEADKTARKEAREDLKEVKEDVREIRQGMQKVLEEIYRIPKPPAERK